MDYLMQADIHRVVVETLAELGKPHADLSCLDMRILIRDGYFIGYAIQHEDIRIVLSAGANVIEFHATDGTLLKTVTVTRHRPDKRDVA